MTVNLDSLPCDHVRKGLHHLKVAIIQRRIGVETEAAESAVESAVAETKRYAQIRADRYFPRRGDRHCLGYGCCVRNQLRQPTFHDFLAVTILERDGITQFDWRSPRFRVEMAEETPVAQELGNEADIHSQMGTDRSQNPVHAIVGDDG
jgi:hypothetical protein